jgi:DNA polymerase-1
MKLNSIFNVPGGESLASKQKRERETNPTKPEQKVHNPNPDPQINPDPATVWQSLKGKYKEPVYKWPATPVQQPKNYFKITTEQALKEYFERCIQSGYCSFDFETCPKDVAYKVYVEMADECEAESEILKMDMTDALQKNPNMRVSITREYEKLFKATVKKQQEAYEYYLRAPLDPHRGHICTVSFSAYPHEAAVVFIDHVEGTNYQQNLSSVDRRNNVFNLFNKMILNHPSVVKIAFNLPFEQKMLCDLKLYVQPPCADPLVQLVRTLQIVKPTDLNEVSPIKGKGLKDSTKQYLGVQMSNFEALLKEHNVSFFNELSADLPEALEYSAEDSDYSLQHYMFWKELAEQIIIERDPLETQEVVDSDGKVVSTTVTKWTRPYGNYNEWLHGVEMAFSRVIGQMEYHGFAWDKQRANEVRTKVEYALSHAREQVIDMANEWANKLREDGADSAIWGPLVNMDPGKTGKNTAVRYFLYDILGCPFVEVSESTGNPDMDVEAMVDMRFLLDNKLDNISEERYVDIVIPETGPETPDQFKAQEIRNRDKPFQKDALRLLDLIADVQKYCVLLTSHIYSREKFVHPVTGRIHAHYTPWTDTGRLNASSPNSQNVPRDDTDPFGIKYIYHAPEGKAWILIDYAGFELRLMAWQAKDMHMREVLDNKADLHARTAATMTGKPIDQITKGDRGHAKYGNFGISYCGTSRSLQKTFKRLHLRKTIEFCENIVSAVHKTFPGIAVFQKAAAARARKFGQAETIFGYKRTLMYINSLNRRLRSSDERKAANTPVQGSAADIMKKSQNKIYDLIARDTYRHNVEGVPFGEDCCFVAGHVDQIQQIHDEVIMEVDNDPKIIIKVVNVLKAIMEEPPLPNFPVKLFADASVTEKRWGEKKDFDKWLKTKTTNEELINTILESVRTNTNINYSDIIL